MKKILIAAVLIVLVITIAVSAILLIRFFSLYNSIRPEHSHTDAPSKDIIPYASEQWPDYQCEYDAETDTLTLKQKTSMDYDTACLYGGSVYVDELAPETYQNDAAAIAFDIAAHCDHSSLRVTLCYLSTDDKTIFTVSSDGSIWTCWNQNEQHP